MPWNQSTIFGYFAEIAFFLMITGVFTLINGAFLLLFMSMCIHHRAFYEIIQHSIDEWNSTNADKNYGINENYLVNQRFICDLIYFHVLVKK